MKRRGAGKLATATLGAVLLIGGCGGDANDPSPLDQGDDKQASQKSDAPSPTPTPTATDTGPKPVPSLQGEGSSKERQQEGEAFLRSYVDELNRATRTGDFSKVKTLFADTCKLCQNILEGEKVYEQGNAIEGGKWTPKKVDYQGTIEGVMMFEMTVHIAESDDVDPEGNSVKHYPGGISKHLYGISDENGKWRVVAGDGIE